MDMRLTGSIDGIAATKVIRERCPFAQVIILSAEMEAELIGLSDEERQEYLDLVGEPAYLEGIAYLLDSQNENGTWGDYPDAEREFVSERRSHWGLDGALVDSDDGITWVDGYDGDD